jgi:chromosome segregation ATPase
MYIKCPASATKRPRTHNDNFFATLAASILKAPQQDEKKGEPTDQYQSEKTERTALTEWEDHRDGRFKPMEHNESVVQRLSSRVRALETSLDLKTHESSVLANECERLTHMVAEERDKQRKSESERKDAVRELKKQSKEKERVCKQIEFLERINYDEKTRTLQSYRESYLEGEMKKMREAFNRTREERERELENQVKTLQEEKFTVESHLRATKIANECLVKQINSFQDGLQDIVINSEEYRKLRDKYVRFLEEYKLLRN